MEISSEGLVQLRTKGPCGRTFTGVSVPEHHFGGVGAKALYVMYRGGATQAAHALSGGGGSEARDGGSGRQRVVLTVGLSGSLLVGVDTVPGALGRGVVQRAGHRSGAVRGGDEGAGVVGVGWTAALPGGGQLVITSDH